MLHSPSQIFQHADSCLRFSLFQLEVGVLSQECIQLVLLSLFHKSKVLVISQEYISILFFGKESPTATVWRYNSHYILLKKCHQIIHTEKVSLDTKSHIDPSQNMPLFYRLPCRVSTCMSCQHSTRAGLREGPFVGSFYTMEHRTPQSFSLLNLDPTVECFRGKEQQNNKTKPNNS